MQPKQVPRSAPKKRAAVVELAKRAGSPPIVAKLLALLAERDRLILLPDLVDAYRERLLDYKKIIRAEITTAAALPDGRARAIEASLSKATGRSVALETRVDASIVGGLIAKVGSMVYDGSITRQLQKLKDQLQQQ